MSKIQFRKKKISIPSKYLLLIISGLLIGLMLLTFFTDIIAKPLRSIASFTVVPFEQGLDSIGRAYVAKRDELINIRNVMEENESLKSQLDQLRLENNQLVEDKYELSELRQLYELDERLADYDKIGARVIGKDPGNWFSTFLINKGNSDGIEINMNVISGSGLVGIVTQTGENWATVRSIIDDDSNVSGMVLSTSDTLMVSGDLQLMEDGEIRFSQLFDDQNIAAEGDEIVTSNISDKFLPGLTIGYISKCETDSNNLTKSGTIMPAVDFRHLNLVLVIKDLK
ncbi:MAG: rod shape-determining protein MreC [Lachnospiraceae bacterium]|nr:rod shape-determining protein MreC [Lachnospiraceae bacterium]